MQYNSWHLSKKSITFVSILKTIATILSVLILIMAMTPCSDGSTCELESIETTTGHDHSQDEDDHCTPFCVCVCCGTTFVISKPVVCNKPFLIIAKKLDYRYRKPHYKFNFFISVWRPPNFS